MECGEQTNAECLVWIYSAYGSNKWEYDGYSYSFGWYSPYEDTIENLHGARLAAYLHNNFGSHSVSPRKSTTKGEDAAEAAYSVRRECRLDRVLYGQYDPRSDILLLLAHPDEPTFYDLIECCLDTLFPGSAATTPGIAAVRSIAQNWLKVTHGNTLPAVQHII